MAHSPLFGELTCLVHQVSRAGDIATADSNFRQSLEVLGGIQSQPEFAQSLLAYGRFQHELDRQKSMPLLKRALALFEKIGADGWASETIAAFRN